MIIAIHLLFFLLLCVLIGAIIAITTGDTHNDQKNIYYSMRTLLTSSSKMGSSVLDFSNYCNQFKQSEELSFTHLESFNTIYYQSL